MSPFYSCGPSGGPSGHQLSRVIPDGAQIIRFDVKWGQWINYFGLWWRSSNDSGVIPVGDINGGDHTLEHPLGPGEYITSFSGTFDKYVNSLVVVTNRGTYVAGNPAGVPFEYQWPSDVLQLVGLYAQGDATLGDRYVDAFGVNLALKKP